MHALTEEDIQKQLSAEHSTIPTFRGKPLGKLTKGLEPLLWKVVSEKDTFLEEATTAMLLLTMAAELDGLEGRKRLIVETDQPENFRAQASLEADEWSQEDRETACRLYSEILALIRATEVEPTKKKEEDAAEPSQAPSLSDSASSPRPPDTASITSAGT